jgi:hypothetical protein
MLLSRALAGWLSCMLLLFLSCNKALRLFNAPLGLILLVVGGGHASCAGASVICVAPRAVANESITHTNTNTILQIPL